MDARSSPTNERRLENHRILDLRVRDLGRLGDLVFTTHVVQVSAFALLE